MSKLLESSSSERQLIASQDPQIMVRNIKESMCIYRLGYPTIMKARRKHVDNLMKGGTAGSHRVGEIYLEKNILRLERMLINSETKFEGILEMTLRPVSKAFIGRKFGITRERVRVVHKKLLELANSVKKSPISVIADLKHEMHVISE